VILSSKPELTMRCRTPSLSGVPLDSRFRLCEQAYRDADRECHGFRVGKCPPSMEIERKAQRRRWPRRRSAEIG
jgi:hypothetical protein